MAAFIMMGAIILQVYAEPLFKEAVPSMPSNTCAILLALDLLVASLLCAAIIDKFGRKVRIQYTSQGILNSTYSPHAKVANKVAAKNISPGICRDWTYLVGR